MAEILFPNDAPMVTGMNSCYLSLKRMLDYYRGDVGCGCIYFRDDMAEALLFFNKERLQSAIFLDQNGKSTGAAAMEILNREMVTRHFKVSVYAVRSDALVYWGSLIHVQPLGMPITLSLDELLARLEKQHEGRPQMGYFRIQGEKRRQLGWVLFREKRVYGFRLPGERALWMEPEELPDFIERFRNAGDIRLEIWALPQKDGGGVLPATKETLERLQDIMKISENLVAQVRNQKTPFSILFRKCCVAWADIYDFLDPFAGELEYREGTLTFEGRAGDAELIEGVCRVLMVLAEEEGFMDAFAPLFQEWKERHQGYFSVLSVRFS